jgi:ATP-dependent Lon protease
VILPAQNARDLDELPKAVRDSMEFFPCTDMSEVLEQALEKHVDTLTMPGVPSSGNKPIAPA